MHVSSCRHTIKVVQQDCARLLEPYFALCAMIDLESSVMMLMCAACICTCCCCCHSSFLYYQHHQCCQVPLQLQNQCYVHKVSVIMFWYVLLAMLLAACIAVVILDTFGQSSLAIMGLWLISISAVNHRSCTVWSTTACTCIHVERCITACSQ